jgi:hypothetical protein
MTYSVTRVSRDELRYTEAGRVAIVGVEAGFDRPLDEPLRPEHVNFVNLVIYVSELRRWDNGELVTSDDRKRIAKNISDALTTAGTKHVLA